MQQLFFYRERDAYGCFSNFARYPILMDGKSWPTSEHYFQAQKFAGTPHEELVRLASSPMMAAKIGRDRTLPLRSDWEHVKDNIMLDAVRAKFEQWPNLTEVLKRTKGFTIVEHTINDSYWGDGGDGTGLNKLGTILMQVRDELVDLD